MGLRPLERGDLPRHRELPGDAGLNLLAGGLGVPASLNRLRRRYDAGEYDAADRHVFLVIEAEGGVSIGDVSLTDDENASSRAASFGVSIGDPAYVGRGHGAEASALFLDYVFGVLGYHEITPDYREHNTRAEALYEKLGFAHEGRRRENHWACGRFWDDVLMGITTEEWWAKHGPPPQPPGSGERR